MISALASNDDLERRRLQAGLERLRAAQLGFDAARRELILANAEYGDIIRSMSAKGVALQHSKKMVATE